MTARRTISWGLCALLTLGSALVAITANEMDDFEDGTTEDWGHGIGSSLVTNVADGGPNGAGDNFLQVESTGSGGPGSRLAVFNESQWTGDYEAIGSAFVVSMDLINLGSTTLNIRVGVQNGGQPTLGQGVLGGEQWVSTTAFSLPAPAEGTGWQNAMFTLTAAEMTQISGSQPLTTTLADVAHFRILSAAATSFVGDAIAATVGIDNINVVSVPVSLKSFSIE